MSEGEGVAEARVRGLLVVGVAHVVALGVAVSVAFLMEQRAIAPLVVAALADLAATLVVFAFSRAYDNSSIYDPYWSVVPPLLGAWFATLDGGLVVRELIVLALVGTWAVRLTFNWARHFGGLAHEDWRYVDMRRKTGRAYWLVSLLGIHLFPTVQVFLGCVALYGAMTGARPLSWLDLLGTVVLGFGIFLEARADRELHRFRTDVRDSTITLDAGVWSWCRHPNYLGEMAIWWGLALFGFAATGAPWVVVGAVSITIMFFAVSIPLKEARMRARRADYADYARRVPLILPLKLR